MQDDDLDVDAVFIECRKFLAVHEDAAVTGYQNDGGFRLADLGTHGRRQSVAHGA